MSLPAVILGVWVMVWAPFVIVGPLVEAAKARLTKRADVAPSETVLRRTG